MNRRSSFDEEAGQGGGGGGRLDEGKTPLVKRISFGEDVARYVCVCPVVALKRACGSFDSCKRTLTKRARRLIDCSFGEEEEGALIGRARAARSLLLALLVCGFSGFRLFPACL